MSGRIYQITNKINNKKYIGKTIKSLSTRFYNHCYSSKNGSTTYFHKALRKYGKNNFFIEEIEICESNLGDREMFWISKFACVYLSLELNKMFVTDPKNQHFVLF